MVGGHSFHASAIGIESGIEIELFVWRKQEDRKGGVMKRLMIVIVSIFSYATLHAQEIPNSAEQQLELLADAMEEENEDDSFLQLADHLRRHPVNLNNAEEGEMRELRILSDLQIENLLVYRRLFGNFI